MALLWGCAASSLSAEVERTTSGLTHRVMRRSGGLLFGGGSPLGRLVRRCVGIGLRGLWRGYSRAASFYDNRVAADFYRHSVPHQWCNIERSKGATFWGLPSAGAACQALRGDRLAWALAGLRAGRFPF